MIQLIIFMAFIYPLCLKFKYVDVVLIFILSWTGESFVDYGLVPDGVPDVLILFILGLMTLKSLLTSRHIFLPGGVVTASMILTTLISAVINGTELVRCLLFLRFILTFYVFFIIIYNRDSDDNIEKGINLFLIALLLLQPLVGTLKWYITPFTPGQFGQESFTGTYATHGGSPHVVIALIAIGFIIPMYFHKYQKRHLALFLWFIWFTIIGSKRAILFVLPVYILPILFLTVWKFQIDIKRFFTPFVLVVICLFTIASLNWTLNPENTVGGSFNVRHLIKYTIEYTTGEGDQLGPHYTFGRYASSKRIVNVLFNGEWSHLFFGYGPGSGLNSGFIESNHQVFFEGLGIQNGITGFIWMVSQVGFVGVGLFWGFLSYLFFRLLLALRETEDPYNVIFLTGTLGVLITYAFDFFIYSEAFVRGEYLLFLLYYFCAVGIKKTIWIAHFSPLLKNDDSLENSILEKA